MGHDQVYYQIASHRGQLLDLKKKLEQRQADSLDMRLTPILRERALVMTGIPSLAQRLLEDQHQQLVRMKSPAGVRMQHRHYVRILEEYISALAELYRAMANESDETRSTTCPRSPMRDVTSGEVWLKLMPRNCGCYGSIQRG